MLSADITGLGAVRSLAAARVPTVAVALDKDQPVVFSRFGRKIIVPPAMGSDNPLLDVLRSLRKDGGVIIPTSDYFVRFLGNRRSELEPHFRLAIPADDILDVLLDKGLETALIARLGIPLPRSIQHFPESAGRLIDALGLPCIIKPRSTAHARFLGRKNVVLTGAAEAADFYDAHRDHLSAFVAQEYIPGDDTCIWECMCTFNHESELVRAFSFRKKWTSPAHNGVTSFGQSVRNDVFIQQARELGRQLKYVGPADIEMKYDQRDDSYKYIEINPRLGMCNLFATRCGVNVVLDAYRVAQGGPMAPEACRQANDVVYIGLYDDLYSRLKGGGLGMQAALDYCSALGQRRVGAYFSWDDLCPGFHMGARVLREVMSSIARKVQRSSPDR